MLVQLTTAGRKLPRPKVPTTCPSCTTLFMIAPANLERGRRFCSRPCSEVGQQRGTRGPHNSLPLVQRFWRHVDRTGALDGCWPWKSKARSEKGYGLFSVRTLDGWKQVTAQRVALILHEGRAEYEAATDTREGCHACDNPPCCNPAHLFWGTSADNHADMCQKGRSTSDLSDDEVREMRHLWDARLMTQTTMAPLFHVDQTTISRIVLRKTHRHIT